MQHRPTHKVTKGTFTDPRDGKVYKTVKIGEQTWFAENLNYEAEGSKCYDNNPDNGAKYGRLYNWETAMKVCPEGWHLPTNEEWDKLYRFVDDDKGTESPYKSKTAGKHLKAKSGGWDEHGSGTDSYQEILLGRGNGTDDYGFSTLPGGYGNSDGSFGYIGYRGFWWSANEDNSDYAYSRYMTNRSGNAHWGNYDKSSLFSVRCLQD